MSKNDKLETTNGINNIIPENDMDDDQFLSDYKTKMNLAKKRKRNFQSYGVIKRKLRPT